MKKDNKTIVIANSVTSQIKNVAQDIANDIGNLSIKEYHQQQDLKTYENLHRYLGKLFSEKKPLKVFETGKESHVFASIVFAEIGFELYVSTVEMANFWINAEYERIEGEYEMGKITLDERIKQLNGTKEDYLTSKIDTIILGEEIDMISPEPEHIIPLVEQWIKQYFPEYYGLEIIWDEESKTAENKRFMIIAERVNNEIEKGNFSEL